MTAEQEFERALRRETPYEALYALAVRLRDEGMAQRALYELFAKYQSATDANDPRYDAIVDVMDLICGGPWAKGGALFETELMR